MTSRSNGSARDDLWPRWIAVAVCAVLLAAASGADAKQRVVTIPFAGAKADRTQTAVDKILSKSHTVVPGRARKKAERKLRVTTYTQESLVKLARELRVNALVAGALQRTGRRYTLTLRVFDGATGEAKGSAEVAVSSHRPDGRSRARIAAALLPLLEEEAAIDVEPAQPPPDTAAAVPGTPQATDDETAPITAEGPRDPDDEAPPDAVLTDPVTRPVASLTSDARDAAFQPYRYSSLELSVGVTFVRRTLEFNYDAGLRGDQIPRRYDGGLVPALGVSAEAYPLAKGGGALAGLGVYAMFERVLAIRSEYRETASSPIQEFDTSQMRFGAGLRYRYNIGDRATLPTIKLAAGWSQLGFDIDSGTVDIDLPDTKYSLVDLGLGLRFPLGTPRLALVADARYLLVLSSGEISDAAQYGDGSANGLDADVAFELRYKTRYVLRLGGRFLRVAHTFNAINDGGGTKTNRDTDPDKDVGGATEQYLSLYASFGYTF